MKRTIATIVLAIFLMAASGQASFVPVGGNLSTTATAYASGGMYDSASDSSGVSLTIDTYVTAFATSMGTSSSGSDPLDPFGGGIDPMSGMAPMSDGMGDASVTLYTDGFRVMGNSHAGVNTGAGNASASSQLNFMFSLTEDSTCDIAAFNNFGAPFGSAYSSLYLKDSSGQNIISLTDNTSTSICLELAAGEYTVLGSSSASVDIYSSLEGMIWDAGGMYEMTFTSTPLPEPATLGLLSIGSALMMRRKR